MTEPARQPCPEPPIANYVESSHAALTRALATTLATFDEPRCHDPVRARRLQDPLVEALAGFAIGCVAGDLATGVRRWFGDDLATAVLAALRPVRATPEPVRFLDDAGARPLVDELGGRLLPRLCHAAIELRALVAAAIRLVAPRTIPFDRLGLDATVEHRFACELERGWTQYLAVLAGEPRVISAMWDGWARLIRREPSPGPAVEPAGYITVVR